MGYAIREANANDFAMVAMFLDEHLRRDYFIPHRQLRDILGQRYHRTVLSIDDGRLLGLAIMTKRSRTLVNLLVDPCERKRGIGDALLSRLRVERVRAKIDVSDGDPRDYYRKRGYRATGLFNRKRNIEIMVYDLNAPPQHK